MAQVAKGCQSVSAEENNLRRRTAKARQNAVRKARAASEAQQAENYSSGFKFVSNESRLELEEKKRAKAVAEFLEESNRIFHDWLNRMKTEGVICVVLFRNSNAELHAYGRLIEVLEFVPEKYGKTYVDGILHCGILRKA